MRTAWIDACLGRLGNRLATAFSMRLYVCELTPATTLPGIFVNPLQWMVFRQLTDHSDIWRPDPSSKRKPIYGHGK
jgi:hypothetical protein